MSASDIILPPGRTLRCELDPGSVSAVDGLGHLWRGLEAEGDPSFFLSWAWIGHWLRLVTPEARWWLPRIVSDGEVVGAGILVEAVGRRLGMVPVRTLHLHATGYPELDSIFIEYNGLLLRRGIDRSAAWAALLDTVRQALPDIDAIHLPGIVEGQAEEMGNDVFTSTELARRPSYAVRLSDFDTSGGYEASLSPNSRQQLRRALRDYAVLGPLTLDAAGDAEERLQFLEALEALHTASWRGRGEPGAFATPFFRRFHRTLVQSPEAAPHVQLLRIRAGSRVVGYLYNFLYRERAYAYQSGFDYDLLPRGRPGVVAHALATEYNRSRGVKIYDHLAGHNQFKASFARPEAPLVWVRLEKKSLSRSVENLLRDAVRRARGLGD